MCLYQYNTVAYKYTYLCMSYIHVCMLSREAVSHQYNPSQPKQMHMYIHNLPALRRGIRTALLQARYMHTLKMTSTWYLFPLLCWWPANRLPLCRGMVGNPGCFPTPSSSGESPIANSPGIFITVHNHIPGACRYMCIKTIYTHVYHLAESVCTSISTNCPAIPSSGLP